MPIIHESPEVGEVMAISGMSVIAKVLSLRSAGSPSASATRIRQVADEGPATFHDQEPLSGALATNSSHEVPSSRLRSILTAPLVLVKVQVTFCSVPICQDSPPFGEMTVIWGMSVTAKISLVSAGVPSASLTSIRQESEAGPTTVHEKVPSSNRLSARVSQLAN